MEGEMPLTPPVYPQRTYTLDDFSQKAINHGQQEINYLITEAGRKVVDAFREVSILISRLATHGEVNVPALDAAIDEVEQAVKNIAGPFPPGCGGGSSPK
jgi:hypothetical protein